MAPQILLKMVEGDVALVRADHFHLLFEVVGVERRRQSDRHGRLPSACQVRASKTEAVKLTDQKPTKRERAEARRLCQNGSNL